MKLKKLVLRDFISQDKILNKKAQKCILGGYCDNKPYLCSCAGEIIGDGDSPEDCWNQCCVKLYGRPCT